jgi:hypothetical protein
MVRFSRPSLAIVPILRLALLFALCLPGAALAAKDAEPAGVVAAVEETVQAIAADGATRDLTLESPVFVGDAIVTGPTGAARISLQDGTVLTLQAQSRLEIKDFAFKGQPNGAMRLAVSFVSGVCRLLSGQIVKNNPDRYVVDSPYATIGIRGTEIGTRIRGDAQLVALLSGTPISVTGKDGRSQTIPQPDYGVDVGPGQPPSAPRPLTEEEKQLFARLVFRRQMDSMRLQMLLQSNRPAMRPGRF